MEVCDDAECTSVLWGGIRRRRECDDDFFTLGDAFRAVYVNAVEVPSSLPEALLTVRRQLDELSRFRCGIGGCYFECTNSGDYERHYGRAHRHICSECGMRFRSQRLLHIHFPERHDEYFQVLAAKKRMFQCLVEECDRKFNTRRGRMLHLFDFHKYPKSYRFERYHKPRKPPQRGRTSGPLKENVDNADSMEVDTTPNISVPKNISFGRRGRGRPRRP